MGVAAARCRAGARVSGLSHRGRGCSRRRLQQPLGCQRRRRSAVQSRLATLCLQESADVCRQGMTVSNISCYTSIDRGTVLIKCTVRHAIHAQETQQSAFDLHRSAPSCPEHRLHARPRRHCTARAPASPSPAAPAMSLGAPVIVASTQPAVQQRGVAAADPGDTSAATTIAQAATAGVNGGSRSNSYRTLLQNP